MAYYRPRKPSNDVSEDIPENSQQQELRPIDIWETIKSPFAGFFKGKNLTYEQYLREKKRKKRGLPPGKYPGRGITNWLSRTITGR